MKKKKIVIFVGYDCNNNCRFCINSEKRKIKSKTTDEIMKEIYLATKKEKIDIIEFIGGETTIRDDFFKIISTAKKLNIPDIVIATNGRMFSDINFAQKALEKGLSTVIFSIHGPDSKTHDLLTRSKGSFLELMKGIENLKKIGFNNINANTTIVKQNFKKLPQIAKLHVKLQIKNVEYIFVDPQYGGANKDFEQMVPKISIASKYMRKALDIGRKAGYYQWKVRYVPLCYFTEYLDQISEINEAKLFHSKHWAPDFVNEDVVKSRKKYAREKTERCKGCKLFKICEGIWKEYIKNYGDKELNPIKDK
ncbi:MAG TPA: radical SAM protein [Elusimicrobiales bacterium]|nr:radical SAM protein [Elusimicrobiales bacterium]HPO94442.1 radical SAM protein [Elusimicrobiales bacterium]